MHTPSRQAQPLAYFLALSLALHGLALAAVLTHHSSNPTLDMGDIELRIQMVNPGSRHSAAAVPSRSLTAAVAAAARLPRMDTETERDALPENSGQHNAQTPAMLENYLIGRLHTELSRHLVYPHLARERGWQGTVLVSVVLAPNGEVRRLRLVQSSGYFLLDEASLTGLRKLRTLSLAGNLHWTDSVEVTLPIRFQLIDNG